MKRKCRFGKRQLRRSKKTNKAIEDFQEAEAALSEDLLALEDAQGNVEELTEFLERAQGQVKDYILRV